MKLEYDEQELDFMEECRENLKETGYLIPPPEGGHDFHGIRPIFGNKIDKTFSIKFKITDPVKAHYFITQLLHGYMDDNNIKCSMQDIFGISNVMFSLNNDKEIVIDELERIIAHLKSTD